MGKYRVILVDYSVIRDVNNSFFSLLELVPDGVRAIWIHAMHHNVFVCLPQGNHLITKLIIQTTDQLELHALHSSE